jgi:DNA-binding NarL/FixJ family response regulator
VTYTMPLRAARPTAARATSTSFANDVEYDWVAVDLAIRGELHPSLLHTPDREEVVRRLNRAGLTDPEIAQRTGMVERTIFRIRKRLNLDSALPFGVTTRALVR